MEQDELKGIKAIKEKCLANAECTLSVAERELKNGVDHICYHLALLGLEEIGKAILITTVYAATVAEKEAEGLRVAMDDHVKKIFWALWGGVLRGGQFTEAQIEETRGLASTLHENRKLYLYTNPNEPVDPAEKIRDGEAEALIQLTRARLELEKQRPIVETFEPKDAENLKWFVIATEDMDKRRFIFGGESIKKLEELGDGKEWISWVKGVFAQNEEEMKKLAEREMQRQKPSPEEAEVPKYKIRIRIQSQSHTIRSTAFQKWNEGVEFIKVYKADKKILSSFAKSEILIDLIFPKSIPIHGLWDFAFFKAKLFIISLNVATKGTFWWNVPKDIEKFFEEVTDLEADKKERIKIGLSIGKRLSIDWDSARLVLDEESMSRVSIIFGFLLREHKKMESFLRAYAQAMTLFSKIDIHLRLEINAFEEFFKAMKEAFLALGDWDGESDFKEAVKKQFSKLSDLKELEQTIQLGIDLSPTTAARSAITLTEVAAMKLYCDFYIQIKANEYFEGLKNSPTEIDDAT